MDRLWKADRALSVKSWGSHILCAKTFQRVTLLAAILYRGAVAKPNYPTGLFRRDLCHRGEGVVLCLRRYAGLNEECLTSASSTVWRGDGEGQPCGRKRATEAASEGGKAHGA